MAAHSRVYERGVKMLKFFVGLILGALVSTATAQVIAKVDTNGVLKGYIVQKNGKTICKDPSVWNAFRGQNGYIVCE
jgi:hypothetical protein